MDGAGVNDLAMAGIRSTVKYFAGLGMPVSFGENPDIGIQKDEVLRELAYRCSFQQTRTIGTFDVLDVKRIYEIYREANR